MRLPLNEGNDNDKANGKVIELSSSLWKQRPLPDNVSPTFHTCNISRSYGLHIKVGLSWGTAGNINVSLVHASLTSDLHFLKPEMTVQLLRMPVQVYSGIAPPPALLAAMSDQASRPPTQNIPPSTPSRPSNLIDGGLPEYTQAQPTQTTDHIEPSPEDIPPDAPPSYEDAIADNMGPIDGPRREYRQTAAPVAAGEKDRGRLFDDHAP